MDRIPKELKERLLNLCSTTPDMNVKILIPQGKKELYDVYLVLASESKIVHYVQEGTEEGMKISWGSNLEKIGKKVGNGFYHIYTFILPEHIEN